MTLTDADRSRIRAELVANADTRAGQAWKGVDLAQASDEELASFDKLRRLLIPVEKGITNPDGSRQVWNEGAGRWDFVPYTGDGQRTAGHHTHNGQQQIPVAVPVKPRTMEEWLASMPAEARPVWNRATEIVNEERNGLLAILVGNAEGDFRDKLLSFYSGRDIDELRLLAHDRRQATQPEQPRPTINYFGSQGAPSGGYSPVINEQPLLAPSLVP